MYMCACLWFIEIRFASCNFLFWSDTPSIQILLSKQGHHYHHHIESPFLIHHSAIQKYVIHVMIMSSFHKILSLCIDAKIEDDFGWIEEWKRKSKQNKMKKPNKNELWCILYVCNMTVLIIPFFLLLILFDRLHTEKIGRIENEKASKNLVWCEESDSFFLLYREKRTVWYILHPSISLSLPISHYLSTSEREASGNETKSQMTKDPIKMSHHQPLSYYKTNFPTKIQYNILWGLLSIYPIVSCHVHFCLLSLSTMLLLWWRNHSLLLPYRHIL